jgi:hypothetical protein
MVILFKFSVEFDKKKKLQNLSIVWSFPSSVPFDFLVYFLTTLKQKYVLFVEDLIFLQVHISDKVEL